MLDNIGIILICMIVTGFIFYGGYVVGKTSHKNKVDKNMSADEVWESGCEYGWNNGKLIGWKSGYKEGYKNGYKNGCERGYASAVWDSRFDNYN